ncbi:hypothetical protein C8A03DRAFT_47893 [Achaetomium macrosporum]|uniref:Zn(2)-C6 fungal-type domain-containing protein n=1 Tax=Achaetomium macrosporum TaxID=79813 RepID=A0AAN7C224_9PEZI|nr:hypothetical protein C8A03DRAFT_47893 [Achaetomium macrosporum]
MNASTRKRARLACKPCRDRKRKCDGSNPCTTCTQWGYECEYEAPRRKYPPQNAAVSSTAGLDHRGLVQRLEANSGAAFVRNLGLKIDPARAPKLNLFAWNVGLRQLSTGLGTALALPIIDITSLEHMRVLAQVYFEKVDPCYGFIDRQLFFERLDKRWHSPPMPDTYDSVLGGVAALGCLFSQRNATITEAHLVCAAISILNTHHLSGTPSMDLLTGWTLRTIYLRLTDTPHSTWIASCTLMHLIEASGIHLESHSVLPPGAKWDPDIQRRLAGIAHHLNVWTSFDLGLSRVSLQKDELTFTLSPKPGDYTAELLGLLPVSVSLDPGQPKDETDISSALSKALDGTHSQPPSVLAQCNLVLCILRRIQTLNLDISSDLAEQALALLKKGLDCAQSMVMACSPWHQVANVPFQIICVLLVMDTRSSLAMLPDAMQTLSLVASTYNTETMREAYGTARLLVLLHQQRRKGDLAIFDEILNIHQPERQVVSSSPPPNCSAEEYTWLESLVSDLPGLQGVDLDQFLYADGINYPGPIGGLG